VIGRLGRIHGDRGSLPAKVISVTDTTIDVYFKNSDSPLAGWCPARRFNRDTLLCTDTSLEEHSGVRLELDPFDMGGGDFANQG